MGGGGGGQKAGKTRNTKTQNRNNNQRHGKKTRNKRQDLAKNRHKTTGLSRGGIIETRGTVVQRQEKD